MALLASSYCAACGLIIHRGTIVNGKQYHYQCAKGKEIVLNAEIENGSHGVQGILVTDRGPKDNANTIQTDNEQKYNKYPHKPNHSTSIRTDSVSIAPAAYQRPHLQSDMLAYELLIPPIDICEIKDCYNEAEISIVCQKCCKKLCGHCVNWGQHDIDKTGYFCKQCTPNICDIAGCNQREFGFVCHKCNKNLCGMHWNNTDETINHCVECVAKISHDLYFRSRLIFCAVTILNAIFNWYWMYLTILKLSNNTERTINWIFIAINSLSLVLLCIQNEDSNIVLFVMCLTMTTVFISFDAILSVMMLNSLLPYGMLLIGLYSNCICGLIYRTVLYAMYRRRINNGWVFLGIQYCAVYFGMGIYLCVTMEHMEFDDEICVFKIAVVVVGIINVLYDCLFHVF